MDRRSYNQYCGLARALDLVGERWTLLIVRNLLLGPQRYGELLRGLPGITTNLLAKRLKELEALGLIERIRGSTSDGTHSYRLTPVGAELEPAVHALGGWGWQWLGTPKKGEYRNYEFVMVALRRRYLGGVTLRAELVVDDVPYHILLAGDRAEIGRGGVSAPDVKVRGTGLAVARLFLTPLPGSGVPKGIVVEGGEAALRALVGAFATEELQIGWHGATGASI